MTSHETRGLLRGFIPIAAMASASVATVVILARQQRNNSALESGPNHEEPEGDPWGFGVPVDRSGFHTVKHDLAAVVFGPGAEGAVPMWVADMGAVLEPITRRPH